jgi:hypothetical protein
MRVVELKVNTQIQNKSLRMKVLWSLKKDTRRDLMLTSIKTNPTRIITAILMPKMVDRCMMEII